MARTVILASGRTIFLLAIVVPTVGLFVRCVTDGAAPRDGFTFSDRQWVLLVKSIGLATSGTVAALVVSIPGAYVVGRLGHVSRGPLLGAMLAAPLLFPPMVYVFGWQKILPAAFPTEAQCIGVWALWAYPIPALVVGTAWARLGRVGYDAALLETSPGRAFFRVVLPLLAPHIATAGAILLVIFLGEYSVPHACSVLVYSTSLLGWAQESPHAVDTLWRSLPLVGVILAALGAARWAWGRGVTEPDPEVRSGVCHTSPVLLLLAGGCLVVSAALPLAALAAGLEGPGVMGEALRTYGGELLGSLAVAGLAGLLVVGMGVCVATWRRFRRAGLVWALVFGAVPGALAGEAILTAYQHAPMLYNHWSLVVVGYVARFGWVGVVAMTLVVRATPEDLLWQARTDGAEETTVILRICAAMFWPTLLFGLCLVAALSLSELPASSLVQVPSLRLIAHILVEKFHRFEDGMLISLSLWLVTSTIPAALLLVIVLRRLRVAR